MLTIAGIGTETVKREEGTNGFPLRLSFWFAWISSTTVGLGDFHIPHETFEPREMFYLPFMFLLAFVLLSNFLHKSLVAQYFLSISSCPYHSRAASAIGMAPVVVFEAIQAEEFFIIDSDPVTRTIVLTIFAPFALILRLIGHRDLVSLIKLASTNKFFQNKRAACTVPYRALFNSA